MLVAALRRLASITVLAVGVTIVVSLLIGLLIGSGVDRALTLGFYFVGSFLLISGFFVQNETINNSAIFIVLGLVLVFIGIGFDSHHSLF
jgi:hypothetical protein